MPAAKRHYQTRIGNGKEKIEMGYRKVPLVENEIYHIYTRSIAEYKIFRNKNDYKRIVDTLYFYSAEKPPCKFSIYLRLLEKEKSKKLNEIELARKRVQLIAYCIMPTHIHLILKQLLPHGISNYINQVLKSYGKYYNIKYSRRGPLCEGRFKNVLVETNEQFVHLTRYIHLNPSSISLVNDPVEWKYSSYNEYLDHIPAKERICDFSEHLDMEPGSYKSFVNERKDYQRELQKIKHLTIE